MSQRGPFQRFCLKNCVLKHPSFANYKGLLISWLLGTLKEPLIVMSVVLGVDVATLPQLSINSVC